jgi:hypothetical protein
MNQQNDRNAEDKTRPFIDNTNLGVRATLSALSVYCFVDHCLSCFCWPLHCLPFFYLRLLITPSGVMVFDATFINISVISWRSVLLVEETTDLTQVTDKLYHTMLYRGLPTLLVIATDSIGSCKSKYHTRHTFMTTSTHSLFGTFKRFLFAGIKGKTLMTIASLHQDTCLDMPDFE